MLLVSRVENADMFALYFLSKPSSIYDKDNPDWAPSQKLGYDCNKVKESSQERYNRAQERVEKRRRSEGAIALLELSKATMEETMDTGVTVEELNCKACQTDITSGYFTELIENEEKLKKENAALKEQLKQNSLSEDSFEEDDDEVLFYNYVKDLSQSKGVLSSFQKFLMNLSGRDLGYRFGGISDSTVSRTFLHVVDVLYQRLKPLIIWPNRDVLRKTLPMDFRKYCPNCVVIIDCFEIFLDRPLNPLARAQTFSSYKHHNTVKYLIGITPQGTVSFISEGWGGRVSDKHLTENSGLLDHLTPGDVILADRGFDIQESVGLFCSTIKIPAFTKGKKQLSGIEVEQTRRIANVRIHVERVIGNIRKRYSILGATQPIDFVTVRNGDVTTLDKIVTVCCVLVNICDSVVPFK